MSQFASLASRMNKMDYPQALEIARELIELFAPVADRLEIAGSVRRLKPANIKDVELCLIPKTEEIQADLFASETAVFRNLQYELALELRAQGILRDRLDSLGRPAFGARFQRCIYKEIPVDLFCVLPPAQWGIKLLLATGPKEFNLKLVNPQPSGFLPEGCYLQDGALYRRQLAEGGIHLEDRLIPTPEEQDVFRALGLPYQAPEHRT
jgi:DNA polymerase/3'-5' exonuclease PolX